MIVEIPLTTGAQSFSISLGGTQYQMRLVYRSADGGGWFLDIVRADRSDAIYGIPLVLGKDLLAQHQYKGFGHLLVQLERGETGHPAYDDMGVGLHLYWSDEPWNTASGSDTSA